MDQARTTELAPDRSRPTAHWLLGERSSTGCRMKEWRYMSDWARSLSATKRAWLDQRVYWRGDPSRRGYTLGTYFYVPSEGRSMIVVKWENGTKKRYALSHVCLDTGPRAGCRCRGTMAASDVSRRSPAEC